MVGEHSAVLRTLDKGASWQRFRTPCVTHYRAIQFIGVNDAFVVGDHGCIARTLDDGASWQQLRSGTTQHLHGVFFPEAR